MANGYLDLNGFMPGMLGPFQPYIDAGLGFARNDLGGTTLNPNGAVKNQFAWGAGVGYGITPNLTLDLAYTYLHLGEARTGGTLSTGGVPIAIQPLKADINVHTVTLSLRYAFGAPVEAPPAPVVAPPPAPAPVAVAPSQQMFIVFFEFDKSALTPDGAKVVAAAARAFKGGKSGVAIAGYTDLAGTQIYNLALLASSRRRRESGVGQRRRSGFGDRRSLARQREPARPDG
jgi:OOP family OmpA-OmpF porin